MRALLLLAVVSGVAWWMLQGRVDVNNPEVIEQPVYLEHRIDFQSGSRVVHMVLFVKTPNEEDCQERTRRAWQKYLEGCGQCTFKSHQCSGDIKSRYLKAIEGGSLETTFLRATRGNRYERSGMIVLWGLNQQESDHICDGMKGSVGKTYTGTLECVRPAGS